MSLTNQQTKIVYSQYGINQIMTYNGCESDALVYLKLTTGITKVISVEYVKGECYSPKGYSSTVTEAKYNDFLATIK